MWQQRVLIVTIDQDRTNVFFVVIFLSNKNARATLVSLPSNSAKEEMEQVGLVQVALQIAITDDKSLIVFLPHFKFKWIFKDHPGDVLICLRFISLQFRMILQISRWREYTSVLKPQNSFSPVFLKPLFYLILPQLPILVAHHQTWDLSKCSMVRFLGP